MKADRYFNHLSSILHTPDDYDFLFTERPCDFNGRIGSKFDFCEEIDKILQREILDTTCNKHGEAFIKFLMENKLCILNGRLNGINDFTCIRSQGRSVVDYCFTPHDNLKYVKAFYVKRVKDILCEMDMNQNKFHI